MQTYTNYLGIDVGLNGGFALLLPEGEFILRTVPDSLEEIDGVLMELMDYAEGQATVCIEDVHAIYGSAAKATFKFGWIKGVKESLVMSYFGNYELVQPKNWQRVVWLPEDVVLKDNGRKDTKATSINAAQRLWPNQDFRKSTRAKKPHDGLVDAALMAEYLRVKHSGL